MAPVVLCGGFFQPRTRNPNPQHQRLNWGCAIDLHPHVILLSPSCAAGLHDRATELFYLPKGRCVVYGVAHAAEHGHSRFRYLVRYQVPCAAP